MKNSFPLLARLVDSNILSGEFAWRVVGHEAVGISMIYTAGRFALINPNSEKITWQGTNERAAVVALLAASYESSADYANRELLRLAPAPFNPQAALHLGAVHFRESETPLGVNALGLTFEDATYEIIDDKMMAAFHALVIRALQSGETSGKFRGESWHYVGAQSCHAVDLVNS